MSVYKIDHLDIPAKEVLKENLSVFVPALLVFGFLFYFWRDYILIDFASIWRFDAAGLGQVWFIFAWAVLFALIGSGGIYFVSKATLIGRATWLSLNAAFWEELLYRWLYFASAMIILPFLNWITFGLVKWFYTTLFIPIANFFTLGALEPQLHAANWVLGAAIISAAASFRDAHKYLGLVGFVNSWFLGMVLFWVMLNHGIITAMVAHFVYDLILFGTRALKSDRVGLRFGRLRF